MTLQIVKMRWTEMATTPKLRRIHEKRHTTAMQLHAHSVQGVLVSWTLELRKLALCIDKFVQLQLQLTNSPAQEHISQCEKQRNQTK